MKLATPNMENVKVPDAVKVLETFGRYHWIHWTLVSLPSMVQTIMNINFVIVAADMGYRCRIPECDTPESTYKLPSWWPNDHIDKCSKPVINSKLFDQTGTCSNASFTRQIDKCTDWIYESNNSIVGELKLACEPWKINMVGVIHNLGLFCCLIVFGWIADRIGRKSSMIVTAFGTSIGLLKLFSVNYEMFVSVDFIEAFIAGGAYISTSTMLIEFSNKKTRVYAGFVVANMVCVGELLMGIFAIFFPYWKHLILLIYAPPLLFISYICLVDESPRWLIVNGKIDEAKHVIEKIANRNKITINKEELEDMDEDKLKAVFNIKKDQVREGLKDIVKSPEIMMRLIVGAVCRFTTAFVYYGILINSTLLPGDQNINFFLSTVMTLPGELLALYLMPKGRKITLFGGCLISGMMCAASGYISTSGGKIAAFLIGKMMIAVCFTTAGTYTMELYPTSTRATLLSICMIATRLGALLAPLTPMLVPIMAELPSILFGSSALISCLFLTLAPETKDLPLLETIQQVENYKKMEKEKKNCAKVHKDEEISKSTETVMTRI